MPHRQQDLHRLRDATTALSDKQIASSEKVFNLIASGEWSASGKPDLARAERDARRDQRDREKAERDSARDPRDESGFAATNPEVIRRKLARSLVVPRTVAAVACAEHVAAVGEPCWRHAVGVCSERLMRALAQGLMPPPLEDYGEGEALTRRAERARSGRAIHHATLDTFPEVEPRTRSRSRSWQGNRR